MIRYLDTSAVAKVLLDEDHHAAMRRALPSWADDDLLSSQLMATELHRLAARIGLARQLVDLAVGAFELVDLDRGDFLAARHMSPSGARTLDALHVAVAARIGADSFVTYDRRQADAAELLGLAVLTPR